MKGKNETIQIMNLEMFDKGIDGRIISIVSLILIAISTVGIRLQNIYVISIAASLLVLSLFIFNNKLAFLGLAVSGSILYPSPSIGWLYGGDASTDAFWASWLRENGWPVDYFAIPQATNLNRPYIFVEAVVVSEVTTLPILPSSQPKVLITAIMPILFTFLACIFVFLYSKRVISERYALLCSFPVLFWIPLFELKTAFRRQSLGIVVFMMVIYVLYRYHKSHQNRFLYISIFLLLVSPLVHHFSSFIIIIGLAILSLLYIKNNSEYYIALYIGIVSFISWNIIAAHGEIIVISFMRLFTPDRFGKILFFFGDSSPTQTVAKSVERTVIYSITQFFGKWLYQILLISGIFSYLIDIYLSDRRYKSELSIDWVIFTLVYGLVLLVGSAIAWLTGAIGMNYLFTFYVMIISPYAVFGYLIISQKINNKRITYVLLSLFIIVGFLITPMHVISSSPPQYQNGEISERWGPQVYKSGEHLARYPPQDQLIASTDVRGQVRIFTEKPMLSTPEPVLSGNLPEQRMIILSDQNQYIYIGSNPEYGSFKINPEDPYQLLSQNNRVYDSGGIFIWD